MNPKSFLVVGGGPAGSAAALTLANHGKQVTLVEMSRYDRLRIGELLSPQGQEVIKRLLPDQYERLFLTQIGTVGAWEEGMVARFSARDWWTVDRLELDRCLFEAARQHGANVLSGTRISNLERTDTGWRYEIDGQKFYTDFVIDATGRASRLARSLGAEVQRYDHQIGLVGFLGGDCQAPPDMMLETTPAGWWYAAPIDKTRAVCVYITDSDFSKGEAEADWRARFEESTEVSRLFGNLDLVEKPVRVNAGFSLLIPSYGHNWAAVGEAAACFDPLSNFGLGRAAEMGEKLALEFINASKEQRPPDLLSFSERLGVEFKVHFRRLLSSYRQIRRFPDSVFWARRNGAASDDNLLRVRKASSGPKTLIIPEGENFECTHCGLCCGPSRDAQITLEGSRDLIKSEIGRKTQEHTGFLPVRVLDDGSLSTANRADGACRFLTENRLCELHATSHKPRSCRQFPFILRETPEGIVVGLSYACPSVQNNTGRPLETYRAELETIANERQPNVMPRLVSISWGRGVSWKVYAELESFLTEGDLVSDRTSPALWGLSRWLRSVHNESPKYHPDKTGYHEEIQSASSCILMAQVEYDDLTSQLEMQTRLFEGGAIEMGTCRFEGQLQELSDSLETIDEPPFDRIVDRFLRNLIRRKFLLSHGPVFHNLIILHCLRQLIALYGAAYAKGEKAEVVTDRHLRSALGLLEARLVGPNRHQIETGSLFQAFLAF